MAHYVFLVGEYDPVPSANGNCVRMLVNELALRGNVVDVICYGNSYCYDYKRRKSGNVCTIKRDVLPGAKLKVDAKNCLPTTSQMVASWKSTNCNSVCKNVD